MITSKIKSIDRVTILEGQHGTTFYHNLQMENGDKINIGKKKEQSIGWELTYEFTQDKGEREYTKAKAVQPMPQTFSKPLSKDNDSIVRQVAFKGVIELIGRDKIALNDAEEFTNKFYNIIKNQ